jgi:hypothetical protein
MKKVIQISRDRFNYLRDKYRFSITLEDPGFIECFTIKDQSGRTVGEAFCSSIYDIDFYLIEDYMNEWV